MRLPHLLRVVLPTCSDQGKPVIDLIEQLVAQALRKSDRIAINLIVDKVSLRFPELTFDTIADIVLRTILARGGKVVWENPHSVASEEPEIDGSMTLH